LLVLRLVRTGRRNQPKFRLVAAEQGEKLDGKVVEILGHYEPAAKEKPFVFDKERVQAWLSKGGMPSNTVAKLLNMNGFDLPIKMNAEAKPRKKAQAKLDAANKPSPAVIESVDKAEDSVVAPEGAMVDQELVADEEAAPVTESGEGTVTEVPVAEETSAVVEEPAVEAPIEETNKEA